MRTLLNKTQKAEWLNANWIQSVLTFNYSSNNSGNVVTIKNQRGLKITGIKASGGGYDMKGTVFGQWMQLHFMDELERLDSKEFYGLTHYNTKTRKRQRKASKNTRTYVDGACGFECMVRILKKIGFKARFITETKSTDTHLIEAA